MGKYGTNLEGFGAFEGGVNADKGAPLVSTSSDGETALLFGPAALREIQAGVANGDFAIPPDAAGDTITAENPLPYWTFTDVNSAGAITCAVVADATAGSGSVLRWSIADTTGPGKSAKITRYIPVPASRDRAFVFIPEAFLGTRTGTNFSVTLAYAWATADLTATGTGDTKTISTGATLLSVDTTPLNSAAPSSAAFIYVTLTIATTGTTSGTTTQDISEIRLHRGDQGLYITDTSSASFAPSRISSTSNVLKIEAATGDAYPISIKTGSAVNNAVVVFGDGATGGAIRGGGGTGRLDMLSADQSAYANVVADRFYPGSQATRYIDDNGTQTTTSAGLVLGNFQTTANAANVRTTAATNGLFQIQTSSRRWKENIKDADAETLAASKRLKARHFNSKHEADNNKRLLGMIAEEVQESGLDCAVEYDAEGLPLAIDWNAITAALLVRLEDAERRIAELESR